MVITSILISCLVFCILFVTLSHFKYWINVFVYAICFTIKTFIITGLVCDTGESFTVWLIINFIVGMAMIWILNKMVDSLSPVVFMVVAILIQETIGFVLSLILL